MVWFTIDFKLLQALNEDMSGFGSGIKSREHDIITSLSPTLPESNRKDYRPSTFQNNGSFQSALQVQLSVIAKYNHTEMCIIQNFWKTWFKLTDPNHTEAYINSECRSVCLFIFGSSAFPSCLQVFHWRYEKEWLTNCRSIEGFAEAQSILSSLNSIKFRENKCCC